MSSDTEHLKIYNKYIKEFNVSKLRKYVNIYKINEIEIKLPTKEKIMNEAMNYINKDYDNFCYVYIKIIGSNIFNRTSRKMMICNLKGEINKNLDEEMKIEINIMMENYDKYEINMNIKEIKIIITVTLGRWENIDFWFKTNIKYRKYKDFTLFLASDKNENCLKQCLIENGIKWDNNKTIEEMTKNKTIINYVPITNSIENIESLSDLMCDFNENILNDDCDNIIRLLKFNNHVGLITKINQKQTKIKQIKTIQKIKIKKEEEVFMDIEAFTNENNKQIPYLICWSYKENILYSKGRKCIEEFINYIIKMEENIVVIYAWYGSGYDYQHIIPYLIKKTNNHKIVIKNNMITYAEIKINNKLIVLKDPYLFLLTSLDKASKAFKVINKGNFPHQIIKKWGDLDKIPEKWYKIQQEIKENKNDNKLKIYYKEIKILEKNDNYNTIINNAIIYCKTDVLAMKLVWEKFKKLINKELNININYKTFTLSQLSMKILENNLDINVKLMIPNKIDYLFMKNAMYGGRVIAKNGIYNEKILYADVVSLYPSAMKLLKHGYGNYIKINKINYEKLGIYKVKLKYKYKNKKMNIKNLYLEELIIN